MIQTLTGRVQSTSDTFAVLEVGGFGLKVFMSPREIRELPRGEATLFTHLHFREENIALYGFLSEESLRVFELLISVAGVGPKSALAILEVAPLAELKAAVAEGRADTLTRASGIGRKTAERVVVELKGRIGAERSEETVRRMEADADVVEALAGLGYRREEAKSALRDLPSGGAFESRFRGALKVLGKKKP